MKKNVFGNRLIALVLMLALVFGIYTPTQSFAATTADEVTTTTDPSASWTEGYIFKDNAALNALVDENYKKLQESPEGYAELRIPKSLHNIGRDRMSPNAITVADKLIEKGYDAYIIGGCIRDFALGNGCDDFDLTTNATIEQQKAIFGEELHTHTTATGREFGYIYYGDERIDLATYQNIPGEYAGAEKLPKFDPTKLTSDSVVFDSFQRDLTINAIYYDMRTEEIVDFHGGIHDVREGIIETNVDPNLIWSVDHVAAVRSIRFKSKYGAKYSDRCEKAMREKATEFFSGLDDYDKSYQVGKMFTGGYSVACYETMKEYGALSIFFPEIKGYVDSASYDGYMKVALAALDAKKAAGESVEAQEGLLTVSWMGYPVEIKKVKSIKKGFKVNWLKGNNCTGYEVRYSLKKNMKNAKKIKTKKTSVTVKKLKSKKTYYVQVYAYGKNSGGTVYSVASAKKKVKAA